MLHSHEQEMGQEQDRKLPRLPSKPPASAGAGPVLVAALAFVLVSGSLGLDSCHLRELDICVIGIASILQNPNGLPVDQAQIERQCEYMRETADCFGQYASKCMTERQASLLAMFSGQFMRIQDEMCRNETSIRRDYIKKATCLRDVQRKHQRACASDLQAGFAWIHKVNRSTKLSTACCNLNRFKECIMYPIQTECGEETVNMVETIVASLSGPTLSIGCRKYDPDSDECVSLLPEIGAKTHMGRNTSALSRFIASYTNIQP